MIPSIVVIVVVVVVVVMPAIELTAKNPDDLIDHFPKAGIARERVKEPGGEGERIVRRVRGDRWAR